MSEHLVELHIANHGIITLELDAQKAPKTVANFLAYVEQGHYGHMSRKGSWLYVCGGTGLPDLLWGPCEQRIHPVALAKHGYAKARRIGMMAMVGGKDKTRIRNATPIPFRDLLLSIARDAA